MKLKQHKRWETDSTLINVKRFVPVDNWILITLDKDLSEDIAITSGGAVDTRFNSESHALITGTVVTVPRFLVYEPYGSHLLHKGEALLEFDTVMNIIPGDLVYFNRVSIMKAVEQRRLFRDADGYYYTLVRYDRLFARIRNNEIYPLNGYILGTKTPQFIVTEQGFDTTGSKLKRNENCLVKIELTGDQVKEYYWNQGYSDFNFVKSGDHVIINPAFINNLENEVVKVNDLSFCRFQMKDIIAIVDGDNLRTNMGFVVVEQQQHELMEGILGTTDLNSCKKGIVKFGNIVSVGEIVYYSGARLMKIMIGDKIYQVIKNANSTMMVGDKKLILPV